MTWKHIAALAIAASMVLVCAARGEACSAAMPRIIECATLIVVGVVGHAGRDNGPTKGPQS